MRGEELPTGWQALELGNIADVNPESLGVSTPPDFAFRYIDLSAVDKGKVNWDEVRNEVYRNAPSRARRIVKEGDVLFGTVRPALQSHGYVSKQKESNLIASTGFAVLRKLPNEGHSRFIFHTILSNAIFRESQRMEVGSNYPAVNESDVKKFPVICPPLPEQRAIATILDTLDDAIRQTEQVIAKLKLMKQGLLHDLLTRGIDENGELRPPPEEAPKLYKESPLGMVPREWSIQHLGNIGIFMNGLNKPKHAFGYGTKFINISDVYPDHLDTENLGRMHTTQSELASYELKLGDIVLDRSSVKLEGVGYPTVFNGCMEPVVFCGFTIRFRLTTNMLPRFLCLQMRARPFRLALFRVATVSANVNINQESLKCLLVVVPPLPEQLAIENLEQNTDKNIHSEQDNLKKLRTLKHGLMDDLLTGRVRVKAKN
jgi:type I restriction enzyme S subunit